MGDFRMPSLGADNGGRLHVTEWLVKVGDEVNRGDIVAVVETEKSTIEVEIFESGVIEAIVVPVGEEVPVGTVLARVQSGRRPWLPQATRPRDGLERIRTSNRAHSPDQPGGIQDARGALTGCATSRRGIGHRSRWGDWHRGG